MKNIKGIIAMLLTVVIMAMSATTAFAAETGAILPDTGERYLSTPMFK